MISDFDSGNFLDSNLLEVFTRYRVPRRPRVADLFGTLPSLIHIRLRWRDAGIFIGLLGRLLRTS